MIKENKKDNLYKIVFDKETTIADDCIYIIKNLSWNDFSFKIQSTFIIYNNNEKIIEGDILFHQINSDNQKGYPEFFSMLPTLEDYRNLMKKFGKNETKRILISLNDLVALRYYPNSPIWIDSIENLDIFKLAFMRSHTQFFTYHNAGDIIEGLDKEASDYISNNLQLTFSINKYNNNHFFDFKFDNNSILPKNINIIIGKNGTGKSQTLNNIVKCLTSGNKNLIDPTNNYSRPVINRLLAIATPGETKSTFPRENKRNKIMYKRLLISRDATKQNSRGIGSLLIQLLRNNDVILNKKRYQIFFEAINVLELNDLIIPAKKEDIYCNTIMVDKKPYMHINSLITTSEQRSLEIFGNIPNNIVPYHYNKTTNRIYPLSSGEITFFLFALQATLFIENGTLVLLDEPETHLHPNLIIDFIKILENLLTGTGSCAIIATHSVYFARELPRSQIHVLKEINEEIIINTPRLKTFGANVNSLSYFVFEDDTTNKMINKYKDILTPEVISELEEELSTEVIMKLRHLYNKEKSL
ncbi:AAA family ATPase [Aliarcobacter cryaerophilus]|uniref:AAA family ATPase n=1 Tax=Aliarcobacter cryaerophilus TaxID=28198 RepID=UPI0016543A47|nr:AAA family ATPase [Aliarcobacter cryaerophilus]QNM88242.1 ATP-binding protein [Aliarcobacter cryaerophilus]